MIIDDSAMYVVGCIVGFLFVMVTMKYLAPYLKCYVMEGFDKSISISTKYRFKFHFDDVAISILFVNTHIDICQKKNEIILFKIDN